MVNWSLPAKLDLRKIHNYISEDSKLYALKVSQEFVAEAPELPGCMAHGETHAKALSNIKSAIKLKRAQKGSSPLLTALQIILHLQELQSKINFKITSYES